MNFEKPNYKITEYVENNFYGKFELEPLERGFGLTLSNALRRVMLSSMPGSAIVAVKIDGVMHEFQTIEGVIEDVTAIILNLKGVVIKNHSDEVKTAHLSVKEEREVTAADIVCDADVEIVNPDHVIANLAKGGKLDNGKYVVGKIEKKMPTLTDFHNKLVQRGKCKELADILIPFLKGNSLGIFDCESKITSSEDIICFDMSEIKDEFTKLY